MLTECVAYVSGRVLPMFPVQTFIEGRGVQRHRFRRPRPWLGQETGHNGAEAACATPLSGRATQIRSN